MLRGEPDRDGPDLVFGEPLGDPAHDRRCALAATKGLHRRDYLRRLASEDSRHRRVHLGARRMTARAGRRPGRWLGGDRRRRDGECQCQRASLQHPYTRPRC